MAAPRGCSEDLSQLAAKRSSSSGGRERDMRSTTFGFPSVTVPVLSRITTWILWVVSRASPLLIRIPWLAPSPVPTIMAVGVASPKAQGQAITRTDTKMVSTKAASWPKNAQTRADTTAIPITAGTKYPDTVSASLEMGAFFPWASSIIWIMRDKVVSSPTWVT